MADGCIEAPPFTPITEGDDIDCKIASYLVKTVVKETLQSAINVAFPVTGGVSILQHLIDAVPGVGDFLGWLGVGAKNAEVFITGAITLPWVETALEDAVWNAIGCAVYDGVKGVHRITDATLGPIRTVIEGLGIGFPEFLTAVSKILGDIGADTLTAIAELATVTSYDCSHCGDSTPSITGGTDASLPLPLRVTDGTDAVDRVSEIEITGAVVSRPSAYGDGNVAAFSVPYPLTVTDGEHTVTDVSDLAFPGGTVTNVSGAAVVTFDDVDVPGIILRFSGCNLQYSTDDGGTWTTVDGWSAAAACFATTIPPYDPGDPPNPLDNTTAQLACQVAHYLTHEVVAQALTIVSGVVATPGTAETAYALLQAAFPGSAQYLGALSNASLHLWADINAAGATDFAAAGIDDDYLLRVQCAMYAAMSTDGFVTAANFAAVQAAIAGATYSDGLIPTDIGAFIGYLGVTALRVIQQGGTMGSADCSSCGSFCYNFDFRDSDGGWSVCGSGDGHWVSGVGWVSDSTGGYEIVCLQKTFTAKTIREAHVVFTAGANANGSDRSFQIFHSGVHQYTLNFGAGTYASPRSEDTGDITFVGDGIQVEVNNTGTGGTNVIQQISIIGDGMSPFGASNC